MQIKIKRHQYLLDLFRLGVTDQVFGNRAVRPVVAVAAPLEMRNPRRN